MMVIMSSMDPLANSAWSRPATVAGFMQSAPNDVLLRYAERERRRAQMNADPAWQAYLAKATPFIQQMENRILTPLSFSPIK